METSFISQPVFLVGAERSGTTLLRLMLDSHPEIAWCEEFEYAVDLMEDEQKFPQLNIYYEWLETHFIFQATNFKIDPNLDYPQLVNSFLAQKQANTGKKIIGATVHRHFDRLQRIWSDAKFIHIVRDPRDVARSCIGMGWAGNVWTGVERWIEAERLWKHFSESISKQQKIEIRYESLISQPYKILNDLCNFMGTSFSPKMLTYHQRSSYDLPDPSLIQQWKNKLSDREIQLIESKISEMLLEKDYQLSDLPSLEVTLAMKQRLKLHHWLKRIQFRIKFFGFYLFLVDIISRRLQLNLWQKKIRLKMNDIQILHLK